MDSHANALLDRGATPAGNSEGGRPARNSGDQGQQAPRDAGQPEAAQEPPVDDRTTPPQRLHLDHFHALDAEHFQLDDNTAVSSLICTRDAAQPDLPPSSCSLRRSDGAESARFDSVAIARMDGTSIHLLRISP